MKKSYPIGVVTSIRHNIKVVCAIALVAFSSLISIDVNAQCSGTNTTQLPATTQTPSATPFSSVAGDYFAVSVTAGKTYQISSSLGTQQFVVREGTYNNATITAAGSNPLTYVAQTTGTAYVHIFTTACSTSGTSRSITFADVTCTPATLNIAQGFNSTSLPSCWYQSAIVSSAGVGSYAAPAFTFVSTATNATASPQEGADFVQFNSYTAVSGSSERLFTVANTTGIPSVDVNFYWAQDNNSTNNDNVQVQYSLDGNTWVNAGSAIPRYSASAGTTSAWVAEKVTLPSAAGNVSKVYIGFLFTSAYGYNCYLDNVNITSSPYTTAQNGDWNTGSTWTGGSVPPAGATCTVNHAVTLAAALTNTGTITISSGASLTTSAAITNSTGTMTVNGTLQLNSGGSIATNGPVYGSGSLLKYNTGSSNQLRGVEWGLNATGTLGTTKGYPYNVQVSGNTTLDYNNATTYTANSIAGSLTVDAGSSFYMDYSSPASCGALTVAGSVTFNGNVSLGYAAGGDLLVGGNWTRSSTCTFNANSRLVTFNGSGTQVITYTGGGTQAFAFLSTAGSGTVQLSSSPATSVSVSSASGLTLGSSNATSNIDLNGQTLTVSGGGNLSVGTAARAITSTVATGTFAVSTSGLTVTNGAGGTLTFGNNVLVGLSTSMNFGSGLTTIGGGTSGTLQINSGGSVVTNGPKYGVGTLLQYNTGGTPGRSVEWANNSSGTLGTTVGYPNNVQISGNSTLNYPNGASYTANKIAGSLTVDAGSAFYMDYGSPATNGALTVPGSVVFNGNVSLGNAAGGDLLVGGNWTAASTCTYNDHGRIVTFNGSGTQVITYTGGGNQAFSFLTTAGSGTVQLSSSPATTISVTGSSGLILGSSNATSNIDINGQTVTVSGGGNLSLSTGARAITSSISGGKFTVTSSGLTVTNGGTLTFGNNVLVGLSTSMNFGSGLTTIGGGTSGTLQINSGGSVVTNGPKYGVGTLLQYNTGGTPGRSVEWANNSSGTLGTTVGYPNNVQISGNSTLNYPNGASYTANKIAGSLTVDAGSAFYMDYGSPATNGALTVPGSVVFNGNVSLGNAAGGDLLVGGNWTIAPATCTLNDHGRIVTFNGSTAAQTITGVTTLSNLTINNTYATTQTVTLNNNVTVNTLLTLTAGKLVLGSNNLTIGSSGSISGTGPGASVYIQTAGSGQVYQNVAASQVFFPVGNTAYDPIWLTGSSTSIQYGVICNNISSYATSPYSLLNNNTLAVSRSWSVNVGATGGQTLGVKAQWNSTAEENSTTNFALAGNTAAYVGMYNGSAWVTQAATRASYPGTTPTITSSANSTTLTSGSTYIFAVGMEDVFIPITPTITSLSTSALCAGGGQTITITGKNFAGTAVPTVSFNGVAGTNVTVTNNTSLTVTVPAGVTAGNVTVTNSAGTSNTSAYTVNAAPTITTQPSAAITVQGSTPTFTVATSASSPTYQWQYATTSGGTYANVASSTPAGVTYTGNTGATLSAATTTSTPAGNSYYYQCIVTSGGCSTTSSSAQMTVYCASTSQSTTASAYITNITSSGGVNNINNTGSPAYTTYTFYNSLSPALTQTQGGSVTITPTISGVSGGVDYGVWVDWNQNGVFESGENVISAGTSTQITTNAAAVGSFQVPCTAVVGNTRMRVVVNYSAATAVSCNSAINGETEDYVFVVQAAPAPTITNYSPSNLCTSGGQTVTINGTNLTSVTAVSFNGTAAASFSATSGTLSAVTPAGFTAGVITLTYCGGTVSSTAYTVTSAPTITTAPAASSVSQGYSTTFAVVASGSPTYQWQYSTTSSSGFANVANSTPAGATYTGATGATLTVATTASTPTGSAYYYQCVVSSGGCSTTTTPVQMVVGTFCNSGLNSAPNCSLTGQASIITNVTLGSINNSPTCNATTAYTLVPAATATTGLAIGSTYTVSVTCDASYNSMVSVWIDYNQNGVFETNEWVQPYINATTGSTSITVPATALTGQTLMRVRSRNAGSTNGAADACTVFGSGTTVDYYVTIYPAATTPSITSFTPTSGYTGTSVTVNGSSLIGITAATIGGTAATVGTQAYTSVPLTVGGGTTGQISITNGVGTANTSALTPANFTYLGYITKQNGDWATASTWLGGVVPPAGAVVTVNHAVTCTTAVATTVGNYASVTINATTGSLTFNGGTLSTTALTNNGTLAWSTTGTLTISGGTLNNGGTLTCGSGTIVVASGGATFTGTATTLYNLTLNGAATLTSVPTITGTMQINSGGSVSTAPTYSNASFLVYNTAMTVGNEWTGNSTTAGTGIPQHVTVQAAVAMPSTSRGMAGNLLISSGSLTLGGSPSGDDFYIGGTWTRSGGTFSCNGRAVWFDGAGVQTISGVSGETFNYLFLQTSANGTITGSIKLLSAVNVTNSGGLLINSSATNAIDLNGQTLTLSGGGALTVSGATRTIGTTSGSGTFAVTTATPTVTSASSGALKFGDGVTVTLASAIDFGSGLTTIGGGTSGILKINSGGSVINNGPKYAVGSLLQYNTTGTPARGKEWVDNSSGTSGATVGYPYNVQISNSSTLNYTNNASYAANQIAGSLTVDASSAFYMDYGSPAVNGALQVLGNVTFNGNVSLGNVSPGDLYVGGNWTIANTSTFNANSRAVFFNASGTSAGQTITSGTTLLTFPYLIINNTSTTPTVTLASPVSVSSTLTMTAGKLVLGNNNLTISPSNAIAGSPGAGTYIQTSGTGQLIQTVGGTQVSYPVGNTAYDPIWLTNGGTAGTCGVICNTFGSGATGWSALNNNQNAILRSWSVKPGSAANLGVQAQWNSTAEENVTATFAAGNAAYVGMYNGTSWSVQAANRNSYPGTTPNIASTGNSSGVLTSGNTYTFTVGMEDEFGPQPSTVVLSSANPSSTAGTISTSTNNNVVSSFQLAVTTAAGTLVGTSGLTLSASGTFASGDVSNFKLWYQTTSTFNSGTATLLSTYASPVPGSIAFPAFTNQVIAQNATGYFFVTADLPCANIGRTIILAAPTTSSFSFTVTPLSFTGTAYAGGTQTIGSGGAFTWVGATGGSWSTASNWSPASVPCPGSNVIFNTAATIVNVPTAALSSITVNTGGAIVLQPVSGGATVTLANSATALNINTGTSLTLNANSTNNITLNYTSGSTNTATIAGTLALTSGSTGIAKYDATNSATSISGILNINDATSQFSSASTNTTVTAAGNVNLNGTAATIPLATWTAGSPGATISLKGSASTIANLNQNFANFTVNAPSLGASINCNSALTSIAGALTITNTNSLNFILATNSNASISIGSIVANAGYLLLSNGTGTVTTTVSGAVSVGGGFLYVSGAGGSSTLNISGALSMSLGQISVAYAGGTGALTSGTLSLSGGAFYGSNGSGTATVGVSGLTTISGTATVWVASNAATAGCTFNLAGDMNMTAGSFYLCGGNSSAGTGTLNMTGTSATFTISGGTFTLTHDYGSGFFNMTGSSSSFVQSGGTIRFNNAWSGYGINGIMTLAGSFSAPGTGTLDLNTYSASNDGGKINVAGAFTLTGSGTITTSIGAGLSNGWFNFTGSAQTITASAFTGTISGASFYVNNNANVTLSTALNIVSTGSIKDSFVVNSGGTLNCGTSIMTGPTYGYFINNGTLILGDPYGITSGTGATATAGNIRVSGGRVFNATSSCNYTYTGATGQATGNGLPASMAGILTVNMATAPSVLNLTRTTAVSGTLALTRGIVSLGSSNLTNTGILSGGSSSCYVLTGSGGGTGSYIDPTSTTASTLLPLGAYDGGVAYYTPLTIGSTPSGAVTLTSSVLAGTPNIPGTLTTPLQIVNLAWSVTASAATTANVTFNWLAANDSSGFSPSSSCDLGIWSGSNPYTLLGNGLGVPTGSYTATGTAVSIPTTTNKWVIGNLGSIIPGPTKYVITSQPTTGNTGMPVSAITVQAQTAAGALATSYSGPITLTWVSGNSSSNMSGTLTVNASGGVATFTNVGFNLAGTYVIKATGTLTSSPNSSNIVITTLGSTLVYGGDGVNWVAQNEPTPYQEPTNCSIGDYRVLSYRRVATTMSATPIPSDGRGQWYTTVYAASSGGNVSNTNLGGGSSNGFIFTSGGSCGSTGTFTNKWNFSGTGSAALDAVNGMQWTSSGTGNDMGLNMSTQGYYTFVFKDAGYTSTGFYVGRTSSPPVTFIPSSNAVSSCATSGTVITESLSAAPSTENVYIRYQINGTTGFTAGLTAFNQTTIAQGTVVGSTVSFTIPSTTLNTSSGPIYYYLFTSTEPLSTLQAANEGDKAYSLLNYDDNSSSLYSYSVPASNGTYVWNGGTSGSWTTPANWTTSGGAVAGTYPVCNSYVLFNTAGAVSVSNVPSVNLAQLSVATSGTSVTLAPAAGSGATALSLTNTSNALSVASGCTLTLRPNNANDVLTLSYTSGTANTANIAGTLNLTSGSATSYPVYNAANCVTTLSGTLNINDANAQLTNSSTTALVVTAAGNVNMNGAASAVPVATWTSGTPGATLTMTGSATSFTGLAAQSFYNVTYNSSTVASNPNFAGGLTSVAGTLSVLNTNSGSASLVLTTTTPLTASIANIVVNGGQLFLTNGSAAATVTTSGNVTVGSTSGSNLFIAGAGGNGTLTIGGNLSMSGGQIVNSYGAGAGTVSVTGTTGLSAGTLVGATNTGASTYNFAGAVTANGATITMVTTPSAITTSGSSVINITGANNTFTLSSGYLYLLNNTYSTTIANATINMTGANSTFTLAGGDVYMNYWNASSYLSSSATINLAGSFVVSTTSSFVFNFEGSSYPSGVLNVAGNFSIGGSGSFYSGYTSPNGYVNFTGASQNLTNTITGTIDAVSFNVKSGSTCTLTGDFAIQDASSSNPDSMIVSSGGALYCGTNSVTDNGNTNSNYKGSFINNGTLGIGSTAGIVSSLTSYTGNIRTGANRIFNGTAGCNYTYNNATPSAQVTGSGLPTSIAGTLTISNSAGVTLSQSTTTSGTLAFTSGLLTLGAKNLTNSGTVTGYGAGKYVQTNSTGQFIQTVGSSQVFYPMGNTAYDPIWLTNGGTSGTCGVICNTFGTGATGWSSLVNNAKAITRSWSVNPSSAANLGVKAQWNSTGEENNTTTFASGTTAYVGMYDNTQWNIQAASRNSYPGATPNITSTGNASGTLTANPTNPYIFTVGMDDVFKAPNDAGVTAITTAATCPTTSGTATVTIKNFGTATLTQVKVTGTGVLATAANSGSNFTVNIAPGSTANITLTGITYVGGPNTLTAATSLPNGVTDGNSANDAFTAASPVNIGLSGTYTVGSGGNFTTITAAVAAYNAVPICGPVTFSLTNTGATAYTTETFPITINANTGASATNTLTIKPATSKTPTISGSSSTALLQLNGASYVMVDGSNTVGGTTQDLTFSNTYSSGGNAVIFVANSASSGSSNNIIQNSVITGNAATTTQAGIYTGGTTIASISTPATLNTYANSNNIFRNNAISKGQFGIYMAGASAETGNMAVLNQVSTCSNSGIEVDNETNVLIDSNTISGVTRTSSYVTGIILRGACTGGAVRGNSISSIATTSTSANASGIFLYSSVSSTGILISNNMIWNITAGGLTGAGNQVFNGNGIIVYSGGGYTIANNTVYLSNNQPAAAFSAALCVYNGVTPVPTGLVVENNIFVNTETTGTTYAVYSYVANTAYTTIDYNDYYVGTGTNFAYLGSSQSTISGIATAFGGNTHSALILPGFVSTTNLDLNNYNNFCLASGTTLASVTTDIHGMTRAIPTMGADEFNYTFGSTSVAGAVCPGSGITVTVAAPASTLAAGTYTVRYDLSGANTATAATATMTYTAGSTNSGTFTIPTANIPNAGSTTLTITGIKGPACTPVGASFAASYVPVTNVAADQATITVVATPSGGTISAVNYCSGAGSASVSVTGVSNATDYVWALPSGLTGTSTTSSITVSGTTPGTYTVSVTPRDVASGITCSGSQLTGTVTIVATPSGGTISSVNYCSGAGSASVSVTGVSNATDYVWSLPSGLTGTSTTSSITVSGTTAGSYTVSVTPRDVASGITCSGSQVTGTVTIVATPSGGSISAVSYCASAGSASVSVTGVSNATDYVWSLPSGLTGTSTTSSITVSGSTPGTYTVSVTPRDVASGITCSGSQVTGTVTILSLPTVTLGASPSVCGGTTSVNLAYSATTGSPNQYSINFDAAANTAGFADVALTSLPASPIAITVPAGIAANTYNATITVKNSTTGCSSSVASAFTITVVATPSGGSISAVSYCASAGSASVSVAGVSNATDYVWSLPSGLTGTSTTSSITVSGSTPGTYTVSVTPRDVASGITCSGSQVTGTVTIVATPSGGSISAVNYCASAGSASVSVTGVSNATDYVWSLPSGLTGTSTTSSITVSGSTPGTYTVSVTPRDVASGITCSGSQVTGTVTILPSPTITSTGSVVPVCYSSSDQTTSMPYTASANLSTGSPTYSIRWSSGIPTQVITSATFSATGGSITGILVPASTAAGTYTGTMTIATSGSCTVTQSISLTVNPSPTITLGTSPSVCRGNTSIGLPYSAVTGSPDQYSINFDAAANTAGFSDVAFTALSSSPVTITVPAGVAAGTYNGTITVKNSTTGCSSSGSAFTVTVIAPATAVANASGNASVFNNSTYTLSGSATNYTSYSWSVSAGTGTLSNTGTLSPLYTPSSGQTGTVTVTLTVNANSPCATPVTSSMVLTITAPAAVTWIGTTTAWATGSNWSNGVAPSSCSDSVLIPSAPTGGAWPIISASTQVGNIEIQNGAKLTINSGQTLSVCGTWNGGNSSNDTVLGAGTVVMAGTGGQSIYGKTIFNNLTINNTGGVTKVIGSVGIKTALTLQRGNFNNSGTVTLKSDATNTGYLDNFTYLSTAGTYTGNLTVERYLSGSVGYRDLSSPVSSTVADWGADFPVVGQNGVYCWYAYNPYPTLQYYKESDNSVTSNFYGGFISYTSSSLPLTPMQGYAAQINTLPMTINTTGTPNSGTLSINITRTSSSTSSADGWNMIGNPYPSPVRWSAIKNANPGATDGSIYRFYASGQYSGNWATHNGVTGTNNATDLISSTQAFFVSASANTTVKINDTVRSAGNPLFFKTNSALPDEIRINLANSMTADEVVAYTDPNATYGYDPGYDATKFTGLNIIHLGFDMPAKELAINVLDSVTEFTELPLRMVVSDTGTYTLTATELNLTDLVAYFKDAQTNRLTDLSLTAPTLYLDGGRDYTGRYSIIFRRKLSTGIGSLEDPNIKIYASGNTVYVDRTSSSEATIDITNELGQRIVDMQTNQEKTHIFVPGHEEFWYAFVRVTEGSKVTVKKVLISNR